MIRRALLALLFIGQLAHARDAAPTLVISDIDDTLQMTYLRPWEPDWRGATRQFLKMLSGLRRSNNAFTGMREIFLALARQPSAFRYVSGTPRFLAARPVRFLQTNDFPKGLLSVRPDLKITTEEFKVERIRAIVEGRPSHRVLFFGDNGERDVPSYARVTAEIGARVEGVYIHQLYGKEVGRPLAEGQEGFLTAADLAAKMFLAGQLSVDQTGHVISLVLAGLASVDGDRRLLAFPRPLLDADEMEQLEALGMRLEVEPHLQDLFKALLSQLRVRVRQIAPCGAQVAQVP